MEAHRDERSSKQYMESSFWGCNLYHEEPLEKWSSFQVKCSPKKGPLAEMCYSDVYKLYCWTSQEEKLRRVESSDTQHFLSHRVPLDLNFLVTETKHTSQL